MGSTKLINPGFNQQPDASQTEVFTAPSVYLWPFLASLLNYPVNWMCTWNYRRPDNNLRISLSDVHL